MKIIKALAINLRYVRRLRQHVKPSVLRRASFPKKTAGTANMKISLYLASMLCSSATLTSDIVAAEFTGRHIYNLQTRMYFINIVGSSKYIIRSLRDGLYDIIYMQFLGSNVSILGRIESVIVVLGATCISQCFTTWLKYFFPQLQRITGRFFVRFSLWWFCAALYRFFGNVLSIPTIRTQAEIGEQRDVLFDTGARFVEPIRADMFNQTLANVMFLEGIGKLNHCAFRGYTALRSVMLPNSCREIDNYAFMGCILLNTVRLGNEIKRIGMGAFDGCTSLQEIILPNSVEVIGQQAFNACQQLSKFTGGSDLLVIGNSAFDGTGVRKVDLSQCHNLCQGEPAAQWRSEEEKQEYVARNRLTTHAQQARFLKRIYTNPPNNCYVQFPNDVNFRYRNAKWHVALRRQ